MCAINGIVGKPPECHWGDAFFLTRNLFLACEHRGRDATGYVARTSPFDTPATASTLVAKRPLTASKYVETSEFTRLAHRRCSSIVGHCRAATHGSPKDNRNNHPHVGDRLVLVHNGICTNAEELEDKYLLDLKTNCDSEAILRLIETQPEPVIGMMLAIKEVRGSMALAVYDKKADCVWLASNGGRPLWLAHLPKLRSWVFASTDAILIKAVKDTFDKQAGTYLDVLIPVPDFTPIALTPSGLVYAPRAT